MARCIAFDKPTAQAISRNLHLLTICDPEADPVQTALHSNAPTSLLAMSAEGGKPILIVKIRRGQSLLAPAALSGDPLGFEASGFLGLSDQPVYFAEPEPVKRWWQRIL
ncbi:MAG TPA: hypothetical protein VGR48_09795 [Terriglobales bacterium]|nr:hypothetical protein [Terriglobales bacterium]